MVDLVWPDTLIRHSRPKRKTMTDHDVVAATAPRNNVLTVVSTSLFAEEPHERAGTGPERPYLTRTQSSR